MDRFICIHGHFYQPPRENPWLEAIETQDSAHPYHDWNERITAECYGPNATARILDEEERIERIVNNYAKISFNFGPTLLSWLEERHPRVYQAILTADKESQQRFSGHGAALAQTYNHMILPLANHRDQRTQVYWGLRDFQHRFGRDPEGMWLAETAVDTGSLEALAEYGIQYTILAPYQAARVRKLGERDWKDCHGSIDTRRPYHIRLPSGRAMALFFYDGGISQAVAFERLLSNGGTFAGRLTRAFGHDGSGLVHIATDGETYGHHHKHGDMALAYALHSIESDDQAQLTNYGEYLERFPPEYEVQIAEQTAWSCAHGVGRWREDCGCNSGGKPGWHQRWRAPLREALDWLRDQTGEQYQRLAPQLYLDPEAARDAYIGVILDRSPQRVDTFLRSHCRDIESLHDGTKNEALKLMEIQRNAMLMYTSCGWFFDDISGIETTQILQYAGRAIQLADDLQEGSFEAEFLQRLERAPSNVAELGHGKAVYQKYVQPARVDFKKLVAHYAASSLFEEHEKSETRRIYAFEVQELDSHALKTGRAQLLLGQVRVKSRITWGQATLSYGILHLGDHNLSGGVRAFQGEAEYEQMCTQVKAAFNRAELPQVMRLLDQHFLELTYSIRSLFRDQQRKVLGGALEATLEAAQEMARDLYKEHSPLLRFLASLDYPLPGTLRNAIEFVLAQRLREALQTRPLPIEKIQTTLAEAQALQVDLEIENLSFELQGTVEALAEAWYASPFDVEKLEDLLHAAALIQQQRPTLGIHLYHVQNLFYHHLQQLYPKAREEGAEARWLALFEALAEALRIQLPG